MKKLKLKFFTTAEFFKVLVTLVRFLSDHYLVVAKVRERLAVSKQAAQKFDEERFNLRKLNELEVKKKYQIEITKRLQLWRTLMLTRT